jgi:histidinol-phosphate aminotransferase
VSERRLDAAALVRPELRELPAYRLAEAGPCRWKLDQNESPWDVPRRVRAAALRALAEESWSVYPEVDALRLRRRLGELHGVDPDAVLLGNGSNELLQLALLALASPGGEVLGIEPSFGLYRAMTVTAGAVPRFLTAGDDGAFPLAALHAEIARDPRRPLVLCAPNNPTGVAPTVEEVEALLVALSGPLLLDNAYGELCRHDYRPLLARHPHLLLFRTLSKVAALAGERVGYLLGDPALVRALAKVKLPYNLGRSSCTLAAAALADARVMERRVAVIRGRRAQWSAALVAAGLEVFPSEASFVLVRAGRGAAGAARVARLRAALLAHGIRVRDFGHVAGLDGCLRITVGPGGALRDARRALQAFAVAEAAEAADAATTTAGASVAADDRRTEARR